MPEVIDKLSIQLDRLNMRLKSTSSQVGVYVLKVFTGFLLGFTLALIGQLIIGYGSFSLTFVSIVVMSVFLKISKEWRVGGILIFDIICCLVALVLKMYIQLSLGT